MKKERDYSLDIIRIFALFSVISVHFFLNNGFYNQIVKGIEMYAALIIRSFFMVCVPLFIILTGYLMNNKKLSKKYYKGICRTLGIYVLSCISCIIYKVCFLSSTYNIKDAIFGILDFSAANYSWYIEMYIGLFLLIPFLNLIYNNIETKGQKKQLIMTFLLLTSIPLITNIYRFNDLNWWLNPSANIDYQKILPSFWLKLYPITYYFIGCYLNEFKINIKVKTNIILVLVITLLIGTFNYYRSYNNIFIYGPYQNWGSLFNVILSILVFNLLSNIKLDKCSKKVKNITKNISDLCLGAYLVSFIFDKYFYDRLNSYVLIITDRFKYYISIVPLIFVYSLVLSFILNKIYDLFVKVIKLVKKKIYYKDT